MIFMFMLKKNKLLINLQKRYSSIRLLYRTCAEDLLNEPASAHLLYGIANAIEVSYLVLKKWKQAEIRRQNLNRKKWIQ